jgi:hypothetical protein
MDSMLYPNIHDNEMDPEGVQNTSLTPMLQQG